MVDHADPDAAVSFDYDQGDDGMPDRTRRAFLSHYDAQLADSGQIEHTIAEIERVYERDPDAVVACSGGKDSMAVLALADAADVEHRALHWDWGARLMPREIERDIVANIRKHVTGRRFLVASRSHSAVLPFATHDQFKRDLHRHDGILETDGSLSRLAGVLDRADHVGRQLVGLRAGESGSRDRKLDATGLYGESLGHPAAFPLREWSARDVWAYLIAREIPHPEYYDRVAHAGGDGSPEDYERARLSTVHDPEFEELSTDGLAAWRHYDIKHPDS